MFLLALHYVFPHKSGLMDRVEPFYEGFDENVPRYDKIFC